MPMPSLFKYFTVVGSLLLGLLFLANYMFDAPADATAKAASTTVTKRVQSAAGASRIERWRDEQAALKAEADAKAAAETKVAETTVAEAHAVVQAAAQEPAKPVAQTETKPDGRQTMTFAPASLPATQVAAQPDAESAAKLRAAKVKKARLARERAKAELAARDPFFSATRERHASNQQDAYYYGHRTLADPRVGYAYAPQQSFGPFGFGRGW